MRWLLPLLVAVNLCAAADGAADPMGAAPTTASAVESRADTLILAPFYTKSEFTPPPAGSYALPPLGMAGDGRVLDTDGKPARLHDYLDGKLVLLSFIYSTCTDVNGCPLATAVMYSLAQKVKRDPQLRDRFRMLSLSFDPRYDTPEVMRLYGTGFGDEVDWQFLTTASWDDLAPILASYGQTVIRDLDENGEPLPSFSHILRVFLIDPQQRVRNIYSVSFLDPELILNDARTVLLADAAGAASPAAETGGSQLSHAGDYKGGYESDSYVTRSQAVAARRGEPADLLAFYRNPPLGLPPLPVPADNPITAQKVALGRKLFFDRRLSLNDTFSCAMCHVPEQGFTNHELATAVGVEGRSVRRNTPTIYNVAYYRHLFHDGREDTLENQVWSPLLAHNEMANPSIGYVLRKLRQLSDYDGLFEAAFDGRGADVQTLGMALASYQRVLVSGNSPFDRWRYGGEPGALSASAQRGFALFTGRAGCSSCHTVGDEVALFTDQQLHNTGTGYRESMGIRGATTRVNLAPGVFVDVQNDIIDAVGKPPLPDVGLYEITQDPNDRWKYRTPNLRNVALTAPYMHNGAFSTLEEVVRFYDRGGVPNELQDPRVRPLGLNDREVADLVAFLESLTGDNVDTIVADAFAAPVGDLTAADPNWAHENRLEY